MTRTKILLGLAVTIAVAAALALVLGRSATSSVPGGALAAFSNHGRPVDAGPGQARELDNVGATSAWLLARRNGRTFYRLATAAGGVCYAINNVPDPDHIGNTSCPELPTSFPTPSNPVLDLSVFEATAEDRDNFHVFQAQGFAADGVESIALVDARGGVITRTRVADNVYALDVPRGRVASAVVARDADGTEVFRVP